MVANEQPFDDVKCQRHVRAGLLTQIFYIWTVGIVGPRAASRAYIQHTKEECPAGTGFIQVSFYS